MLLDLKTPLASNTSAPLVLTFKDAGGHEFKEELKVPVLKSAPEANLTGPAKPAAKSGGYHLMLLDLKTPRLRALLAAT